MTEKAKQAAAQEAFKNHLEPLLSDPASPYTSTRPLVIGIGSGSTIVHLVHCLAAFPTQTPFHCIPTSFQSRQLLLSLGLPVSDLDTHPRLDIAIDGADEVDTQLNCIKGGGGCHAQEKVVAYNARQLVVVADDLKASEVLGSRWTKGVPVEVLPMAYVPVMRALEGWGAKVVLRMGGASKAGPCVSDNGCFILDAHFGEIRDPAELDAKMKRVPGVVETGLFVGMVQRAYFGHSDG